MILEPRRDIDQARCAVVMEAFVQGVLAFTGVAQRTGALAHWRTI